MYLAKKIYSLRKEHNLSQEDVAKKIGVSRQTVSKWESGDSNPDSENIVKLSNLFNVSTDYLLYNQNETEDKENAKKQVSSKRIMSLGLIALGLGLTVVFDNKYIGITFIFVGITFFFTN